MKAQVFTRLKSPLAIEERSDLVAGEGQVVVDLKSSALNRRDYWITQGMYPGIELPVVLGSDGAGVASSLGNSVDSSWQDAEVLINPGWNWGSTARAQSGDFQILGMPTDGTFAEQVSVPADYLHRKPDHMDWHQAAALPLAGLTAYRALLTQGQLSEGQSVLITGVGGGVAGYALQFALAAGATVFVTSSSAEKLEHCVKLGAKQGFNYKEEDWHKELLEQHGPVDLIIDSAGGAGYASLIECAAFGGRIVNYGATTGPPEKLDMFSVFWKQLTLQGTTMGSPADFTAMLEFVSQHKIVPIVDEVLPLESANEALARMAAHQQFGKIVLSVSN